MNREVIGEYFRARRWGGSALVMLAITMLWFLISVQVFGILHIPLSYAARGVVPRWSVRYMQVIGYCCLISTAIDVVGIDSGQTKDDGVDRSGSVHPLVCGTRCRVRVNQQVPARERNQL